MATETDVLICGAGPVGLALAAELTRYGPPAVPLDLLYLPGQPDPVVLPKILTPDIVLDALGHPGNSPTPPK